MAEWETAYHWPTGETEDVQWVLNRKEEGRYETGDCWCHESCFKGIPRTGCAIFPIKESVIGAVPHFSRKSGSFTKVNECVFDVIRKKYNESQRYAQFYHDLRKWLNGDDSKNDLAFFEFHETKSIKYSDFILHHKVSEKVDWEETDILIVHKNRRRYPNTSNIIYIDLSHWTMNEISNFESFGKRKIIEEFERLILTKEQEKIDLINKIKREAEKAAEMEQEARHKEIIRLELEERYKQKLDLIIPLLENPMKQHLDLINLQSEIILKEALSYVENGSVERIWGMPARNIIDKCFQIIEKISVQSKLVGISVPGSGKIHIISPMPMPIVPDSINSKEEDWNKVRDLIQTKCGCLFPPGKWHPCLIHEVNKELEKLQQANREEVENVIQMVKKRYNSDLESFRNKAPFQTEAGEFRTIISERLDYFNMWLEIFSEKRTDKYSQEKRKLVVKRVEITEKLLSQSEEQWCEEFRFSEQSFDDYMLHSVDQTILEGVEQGFNMLGIPMSEWKELSDKQKQKLSPIPIEQYSRRRKSKNSLKNPRRRSLVSAASWGLKKLSLYN